MNKEPVIVGQIVGALGLVAMFYPPVREAIEAAGGEVAFGGAITAIVSFVTYFMRSRVSPVD